MSEPASTVAPLDYAAHVARLRARAPELADAVAGFWGVEEVLQWMQRFQRGKATVDIVGQDEFSYDFLVQLEPGGRWLAFGVT
jgi:hypothetical protein